MWRSRSAGEAGLVLLAALTMLPELASGAGSDMASAMDKEMTAVYVPEHPGAAIIVLKDGQVVFRKGYGLANLELKATVKPESVFRLASVTKQFTAAAIMMLVEQGRISLTDDITKYLPDYPTGGTKITVENLLTHTSGIKDYLNDLWPARMSENLTPRALIDVFKSQGLAFAPGSKADYSNSNYVLLGAIIEKVSGLSYGRFIEERIFRPLGMTHSCYERPQRLVPNRVSGYLTADSVYINAASLSMSQLYAAGALCSSVDDLALWDGAMDSEKLLKRSSWERLLTPYRLPGGDVSPYASGWAINQLEGRTVASQAGGIPGFRAYVLRIPSDHVYVALLSNDETAATQPEYVARRIAAIALGALVSEPTVVQLDEHALERYVGKYGGGSEALTVRRDGARLLAQDPENPEVELFPVGGDAFIVKAFDARITFTRDARGEVTGLVFSLGGHDATLKKER